jgi:D-ornithine 4,5-aminomutase subunit alpha
MGIASTDTKPIVEGCIERGLMGRGAGHVVYKLAASKHISIKEAASLLAAGKGWDQ